MNAPEKEDKLAHAYHKMIDRVRSILGEGGSQAEPKVYKGIEAAKKDAVETGELTPEEANRLGEYLRRDLQDAATYLSNTGKALSDWLMLDLELIEEQLLDAFSQVADKTQLELALWAEQARHAQDYQTGEIAGIGTFACLNCGEHLYFPKAKPIPPCPKCHHTLFKRIKKSKEAINEPPQR
jgi:polyhydroxyalkanoate synthesis regulator phasin